MERRWRSAIVVIAAEDEGARAGLGHRTTAADDTAEGVGVAALENEEGAVGDVTRDAAGRAVIADLQDAATSSE